MTRHENVPRKPTPKPKPKKDVAPAGRQRIAKLMARVGLCSRRDAEAWIVDGRVSLNGETLTSPAQDVGPEDVILVDGTPLPQAEKTRLFIFHKPRGLVTSDHDPEGRATVADFLREHWPDGPRVVTIGRLDINTEGLLLLTNDGGLARVLELPQTGWVRRYRVRAKGETDQGVLDRLHDGLTIEGVDYAGIEAKLDRSQGANCWLTMGLREGKNREIKRVLEHIGLEVNRLIRLSFGPFQLLDLPEGKVEEVRTRVLRDQLGESLAAAAGVDFQDVEVPAFGDGIGDTRVLAHGDRPGRERAGTPRRDSTRRDDKRPGKRVPSRDDTHTRRARPDSRSEEAVPARRERPVAGTRKHVSLLRADETVSRRDGPRKRIERTDTKDRRDRTVTVERLVRSRPETASRAPRPAARRGAGRFVERESAADLATIDPKAARGDRRSHAPETRGDAGRPRDHASPSAMAKRVRIARSGGEPTEAREQKGPRDGALARPARPAREGRGERSFAAKPTGGKTRSIRPAEAPAQDDRPRPSSRDEGRATRSATRERPDKRPSERSARRDATVGRVSDRPRSKVRIPNASAPNDGAKRRVGERDAAERDSRKAGNRPAPRARRDDDRRERPADRERGARNRDKPARPPGKGPGKRPVRPTRPKR